MKRWTEKEIEKLLYLADAGFNNSKIAEVLGRTEYSIVSKLKNINYKREMVPKYRYKIGEVVNGNLKIVEQIRVPNGENRIGKGYKVQSLSYLDAPVYSIAENNLNKGQSCSYEAGRRVYESNSLYSIERIRPYIVDIEEAKTISSKSGKEVEFKCPECEQKKSMKPLTLMNQGFSCPKCSISISYPELLFKSVNDYFNKGFIPEQKLPNSSLRFDFVNYKTKVIVETHGIQHYKDNAFFNHKHTIESDIAKRRYCEKNNWTLIELDCQISEFEYIINNINANELLPNINEEDKEGILKIMEENKRYPIKEIITLYKFSDYSTLEISEKFKMSYGTLRNILKKNGVNLRRMGKVHGSKKHVRCVNTGKEFSSALEASKWCGLKQGTSIGYVCNGKRKSAGKHPITGEKLTWEYVD